MAKFLAQIIVTVGQILTRAVGQAYTEALSNAAVTLRGAGTKMVRNEALKILDIKPTATLQEAAQKCEKYMASNDPAKGGSFYIQSKVFRAYECLENEAKGAAGKAAGDAGAGAQSASDSAATGAASGASQ